MNIRIIAIAVSLVVVAMSASSCRSKKSGSEANYGGGSTVPDYSSTSSK